MKKLFIFLFFFSISSLYAQSISYSTEEEHAQKWLIATTNFTGLPVGSHFPSQDFSSVDGESIRIPDAGKKLYVVHFWFVGCGAFAEEEAYLRKLQHELKDHEDIDFISFCASPEDEITQYFKENDPLGFKLVSLQNKEKARELFQVEATTTHMLVNEEGQIIENFTSAIYFDEMYDHYKSKILERL